jgi:pSer/pThr/pTyr-binding forkhead associated (FHA) protein
MCPTCGHVVGGDNHAKPLPRAVEELESELLYQHIEPVVGWLACIDGPRRGQSFTLHEGKNFIGRGDDMDVQILGDPGVSRNNHASVAYDHKNRSFVLVPGDSDGIVYLEDKAVFQATELMDLNRIQIGNTTLVFRPLCGEHFSWRTGKDEYAPYEHSTR